MTNERRPTPARDDDERDAYLQRALRHAPDADLTPPVALSEAILREARNATLPAGRQRRPAVTSASAARVWGVLTTFWSALARPPVAAAFASLMVATLAGVLWWGAPINPGLHSPVPSAEAPRPVAPAPARDAAKAAATPAAMATAPPTEPGTAHRALPVTAVPRANEHAARGRDERVAPALAAPETPASAAPAAQTAVPAVAAGPDPTPTRQASLATANPELADAPISTSSNADARAPADLESKARAETEAATGASESTGPEQRPAFVAGRRNRADAAPAAKVAISAARPPEATPGRSLGSASPEAAAPLAKAEGGVLVPSRAVPPATSAAVGLGDLRGQITTEAVRWRWRVAGADLRPVSAALLQWLARLDGATGTGWTLAPESRPAETGVVLELLRDGALHSRFWISVEGIHWGTPQTSRSAWQIRLAAPVVRGLQEALDELTR